MIEGRELTMDDYKAMLRRRWKAILVPALLAPLAGFLVSYAFPAKYTSQSLILVEGQKVPESMVQPVVSEAISARIATLVTQVQSQSLLQPMVQRLYPNKNPQAVNDTIDEIRTSMTVQPVPDVSQIGVTTTKNKPGSSPVPGFYLNYTAPNPREAQQICSELTSLIVDQNIKELQEAATGTSEVLNRGIEDAKNNLDSLDAKMAEFKKKYVGQLPGDEDTNMKVLMSLNTQLEAVTQGLNKAQQDKTYYESQLSQELAQWKSSQTLTSPETLQKQLSDLQSQLLSLQAKYTDDHPDVIKTKSDIAEVKKKLAEVNKESANPANADSTKASASEPPEIRQTRLLIHQQEDQINVLTRAQKKYQADVGTYQGRVSLSPAVEEEYKALNRDYSTAQKSYEDLLKKKSDADLTVKMTNQAQGERMFPLNPANLPDSPSFPNRLLFAGAGLGAGLALGLILALGVELTDKSIRNEADAEAALDLPLLVAIPWVGDQEKSAKDASGWSRLKPGERSKETARA